MLQRKLRQNPKYIATQRKRNAMLQRKLRQNPKYIATQRKRNAMLQRKLRQNPKYRATERKKDCMLKQVLRENPKYRATQRKRNAMLQRKLRQNPKYRATQRKRNAMLQRKLRQNPKYIATQRKRNAMLQRKLRQNPKYIATQRKRNAMLQRKLRQNPKYRATEREKDAMVKQLLRENPKYRATKQKRDTVLKQKRRQNTKYRANERKRDNALKLRARIAKLQLAKKRNERVKRYRMFKATMEQTREANRLSHEQYRELGEVRTTEQKLNTIAHRIQRNINKSIWNLIVNTYEKSILLGPSVICTCCGGLFFPTSTKKITRESLNKKYEDSLVNIVFFLDPTATATNICFTCRKSILSGKIPKLSLSNGLHYSEIPSVLQRLSIVEERLCAIRLPFMQIRSLGCERQSGLKGNVVNVPISIDTTVSVLPRTLDQSATIQLKLKRKLSYTHHYLFETIRPYYIHEACKYLIETPLYKKEGVILSEEWVHNRSKVEPFVVDKSDLVVASTSNIENSSSESEQSDKECNVEEINPGGNETLLDNEELQNIALAPGEGRKPMGLLVDTYAEELAFPTIYGGCPRDTPLFLTYANIARSEARRADRRAARVDKLLYASKKLDTVKIANAIRICMRKKKRSSDSVTAEQMLNKTYVSDLIQQDDGFRMLKEVRTSPAHWEQEKKKLMAMIRQCGIPTFFITLSAAETKWPELLVCLFKVVDNKNVTQEETLAAPFQEKARLIRRDPITCSRYFEYRTRNLIKTWKCKDGPFSEFEVCEFYWRVEFQHRGSPHLHGLLWLKNAPIITDQAQSIEQCENFIDRFITVDSSILETEEYIPLQVHHHSHTCRYKYKKICRFGIPFPPMRSTRILKPLSEQESDCTSGRNEQILNRLKELQKKELNISFDELLIQLDVTEDEFVFAIRSLIKRTKVFLKRKPKDAKINAYNTKILTLHRANMDIQFVTDAYACCSYIINYINKSNRGLSKLLREAQKEVRLGNVSIKRKLQVIANTFLNGSEISAQEAAYNVLGLPLSNCSRSEVFINTSPPNERVKIVKSEKELKMLDSNSKDIYCNNIIDRYGSRPNELEDYCLAYFACNIIILYDKKGKTSSDEETDEVAETDCTTLVSTPSYVIKMRKKSKLMRSRRYNLQQDRVNYLREQLMLFYPWRNEEQDLISIDHESKFAAAQNVILKNRSKFNYYENEAYIDTVLQEVENEIIITDENETDEIDDEFRAFSLEEPENVDIFVQMGEYALNEPMQTFTLPNVITESEYCTLCRLLNVKQREYLLHVYSHLANNTEPLYEFVTGGAGTGKSKLIEAIFQTLVRYYNNQPGIDPSRTTILLCAPTGKASFNINGITLHQAFSLPLTQYSGSIPGLNSDILNTISTSMSSMKLLIIDEISMVGTKMFHQINSRMQQIFRNNKLFGGISILVFGDLRQLPPVGDKWIFESDSTNPLSMLVGSYLWEQFKLFELTEIMRQKDDVQFASILNNMASGEMTEEDITIINTRICPPNLFPENAINLFYTNREISQFNNMILGTINTETAMADCFDSVYGEGPDSAKRVLLESCTNLKVSETYGLPSSLLLKVDARYMFTVNINVSEGLVNGATGYLRKIDYGVNKSTGARIPMRLWLEFSLERIGCESRRTCKQKLKNINTNKPWTPITTIVKIIKRHKNTNLQLQRRQFPLIVAEAITVHKSQGETYDNVVVNIDKRGFSRALLYVACSRSRRLDGLHIKGEFTPPKKPTLKDRAFQELRRLQENPLKTKFSHLQIKCTSELRMIYHNVQNLNKHHEDMLCDSVFMSSNLLCFVETWTLPTDVFAYSGFTEIGRIDCKIRRRPYGVACYSSEEIYQQIDNVKKIEKSDINGHIQCIRFDINKKYTFCIFYNAPNTSYSTTKSVLSSALTEHCENVLIIGDMNMSLNNVRSLQYQYLVALGYKSMLKPCNATTRGNTCIDWCFSNMNNIVATVYESLFSYHRPICVSLKYSDEVQNVVSQPEDNNLYTRLQTLSEDNYNNQNILSQQQNNSNTISKYFTNDDQVSCYANVIIMMLTHVNEFVSRIKQQNHNALNLVSNSLKELWYKYVLPSIKLNTFSIRTALGNKSQNNEHFLQRSQQCCVDFLLSLINEIKEEDHDAIIPFEYKKHIVVKCFTCNHSRNRGVSTEISTMLTVPESKDIINFTSLLIWEPSDEICLQCGSKNVYTKEEILDVNEYVIIILKRFNNNLEKIKTKINITDHENINLDAFNFELSTVILHIGETINSGHYTVMLKSEGQWLLCDDQDETPIKPHHLIGDLANAYVLLLKRV